MGKNPMSVTMSGTGSATCSESAIYKQNKFMCLSFTDIPLYFFINGVINAFCFNVKHYGIQERQLQLSDILTL